MIHEGHDFQGQRRDCGTTKDTKYVRLFNDFQGRNEELCSKMTFNDFKVRASEMTLNDLEGQDRDRVER